MRYPAVHLHLFVLQSTLPVDDVITARSVGDHGDRKSDPLFDEFDIFPAVLRQFLIGPDAADVTFPARQGLIHGFCLFQQAGRREVPGDGFAGKPDGAEGI